MYCIVTGMQAKIGSIEMQGNPRDDHSQISLIEFNGSCPGHVCIGL